MADNSWMYFLPQLQSSNSNTTTTQKTTIPQWLTDASQYGIGNAKNILAGGAPQYNAPLAAGLNEDQQQAGQQIRDSQGMAQPYYDQARGAISGSMDAINPSTLAQGLSGISQYMNPYISNVVDSVKALGQQNLDQSLKQTDDQAIAAKAFGGSRHGVQEGVATAQNNLGMNKMIADLMQGGYNTATNLLGADVQTQNAVAQQNRSNALAGGQAMAGLGTTAQGANTQDINNLLTYGNLGQQTAQNALDKNYNLWNFQTQFPLQAQQVYNQTVSSAPHDTSSTGTSSGSTTSVGWAPQQQQSSNPWMTGLGGLMGLGSMFAAPAGGVSAMSGLGSALKTGYGLLSDKDMKTDIKKLGKDDETGLDIYSYRYKGDPKTYPKVVGPMAQDIEKNYPGATKRRGDRLTVHPGAFNSLAGKFAGGEASARGLL